jgi:hypothetical protein
MRRLDRPAATVWLIGNVNAAFPRVFLVSEENVFEFFAHRGSSANRLIAKTAVTIALHSLG